LVVKARYVHTNLVARDWRKLVEFYVEVFGCKRVPPERKISGQWLDDATGIAEAEFQIGRSMQRPYKRWMIFNRIR